MDRVQRGLRIREVVHEVQPVARVLVQLHHVPHHDDGLLGTVLRHPGRGRLPVGAVRVGHALLQLLRNGGRGHPGALRLDPHEGLPRALVQGDQDPPVVGGVRVLAQAPHGRVDQRLHLGAVRGVRGVEARLGHADVRARLLEHLVQPVREQPVRNLVGEEAARGEERHGGQREGDRDGAELQRLPPAAEQHAAPQADPAEPLGAAARCRGRRRRCCARRHLCGCPPALYPMPRTVSTTSGFSGSRSTLERSRCTCTLTSRLSAAWG